MSEWDQQLNDDVPNWEEIAKKKPPEDNRFNKAWAGAWLEGEMVGFARCMVKCGLHKREQFKTNPGEMKTTNELDILLRNEIYTQISILFDPGASNKDINDSIRRINIIIRIKKDNMVDPPHAT